MIDKQTQDQAWQSLPPMIREGMRKDYKYTCAKENLLKDVSGILSHYFCEHNLASDEEPASEKAEPRFKVGDFVRVDYIRMNSNEVYSILDRRYSEQGWVYEINIHEWINEMWLILDTEPTETETNEDVEEKELNLCEILKGHEDELFYSPVWGDTYIAQNRESSLHIIPRDEEDEGDFYFVDTCGRVSKECYCILYPSRDLYLKYPLDACAAWNGWLEAQKPNRWRAEKGEDYWTIDSDMDVLESEEENDSVDGGRYKFGNYFRTESEAQQAADLIRETLERFHQERMNNKE